MASGFPYSTYGTQDSTYQSITSVSHGRQGPLLKTSAHLATQHTVYRLRVISTLKSLQNAHHGSRISEESHPILRLATSSWAGCIRKDSPSRSVRRVRHANISKAPKLYCLLPKSMRHTLHRVSTRDFNPGSTKGYESLDPPLRCPDFQGRRGFKPDVAEPASRTTVPTDPRRLHGFHTVIDDPLEWTSSSLH